jgi:hypothetical protein
MICASTHTPKQSYLVPCSDCSDDTRVRFLPKVRRVLCPACRKRVKSEQNKRRKCPHNARRAVGLATVKQVLRVRPKPLSLVPAAHNQWTVPADTPWLATGFRPELGEPTAIPPGPGRVEILARRVALGQELFHPDDADGHDWVAAGGHNE